MGINCSTAINTWITIYLASFLFLCNVHHPYEFCTLIVILSLSFIYVLGFVPLCVLCKDPFFYLFGLLGKERTSVFVFPQFPSLVSVLVFVTPKLWRYFCMQFVRFTVKSFIVKCSFFCVSFHGEIWIYGLFLNWFGTIFCRVERQFCCSSIVAFALDVFCFFLFFYSIAMNMMIFLSLSLLIVWSRRCLFVFLCIRFSPFASTWIVVFFLILFYECSTEIIDNRSVLRSLLFVYLFPAVFITMVFKLLVIISFLLLPVFWLTV